MNILYSLTVDQYLELMDLAILNGKVAGELMDEEFEVIVNKYNLKPIGSTELDLDMLTGEMRDSGIKVTNINELERQKKLKEDENGQ